MHVENKYRATRCSSVLHIPLLFQNRNVILNSDNLALSQLFHLNKREFVGIISPQGRTLVGSVRQAEWSRNLE